jgi:hypothetical protein
MQSPQNAEGDFITGRKDGHALFAYQGIYASYNESFILFMIYPVLGIFYNSFFQVTMLTETPVFVGLENFTYLLTDGTLWLSLKNTFFNADRADHDAWFIHYPSVHLHAK